MRRLRRSPLRDKELHDADDAPGVGKPSTLAIEPPMPENRLACSER